MLKDTLLILLPLRELDVNIRYSPEAQEVHFKTMNEMCPYRELTSSSLTSTQMIRLG